MRYVLQPSFASTLTRASLNLTSEDLLRNAPKSQNWVDAAFCAVPTTVDISTEIPSLSKLARLIHTGHTHHDGNGLSYSDGICGAVLEQTREFITSPNCCYLPNPPSGSTRDLYRRQDARYGPDDPIQWPQPFNPSYPFFSAISKRPPGGTWEGDLLWMNLAAGDLEFSLGGTQGEKGVVRKDIAAALRQKVDALLELTQASFPEASSSRESKLVQELFDTVWICLNRISRTASSLRDLQRGLSEVQRSCLTVQAILDYYRLTEQSSLFDDSPRPVDLTKMGSFVWQDTDARLLFRAGLPVFYLRPWSAFDRQVIYSIAPIAFAQPPEVILAPAVPPYHPLLSSQAGSDTKFAAIRKASINCFASTSPFENLHIEGAYASSYDVTKLGRITCPTASPASSSLVHPSSSRQMGKRPHHSRRRIRRKAVNDPTQQRNPFGDLPKDDDLASPAIETWANVNSTIDRKQARQQKKTTIVPDPGLFFGTEDPARQNAFFYMWQHFRPAWLHRLSQKRSPQSAEVWRKVLSYMYIKPPKDGAIVNAKTQAMVDARNLVEETMRSYDPQEPFHPPEVDTSFIPFTARCLVRELSLINFRDELFHVDAVLDRSKPTARPTLSLAELDANLHQHGRYRTRLVAETLGYDGQAPPSDVFDVGLTAVDWVERYKALKAFWKLLDTWPGEKPDIWCRGMNMDLTNLAHEAKEWELSLAKFYNYYHLGSYVLELLTPMKDELCHWLDSHPKETSTKLDEMMVDSEHNSRHLIQHLYVRNLRTLGVGQWLDDEVINYFVKKWCSASTSRKTLGLNTWFAGRFLFQDHRCVRARTGIITPEHEQKVLRWCLTAQGKQGVQSWENVFIPINENNHHWYSACINFPDKRIDIYDSFSETYYGNYKKPIHLKENTPIMLVLMWLAQVLGHLRGEEVCLSNQAYTEWKCEPHQKVPFQHNSYDCGVHILWHLLHVLEFGSVRSDCTSPKLKFASDMVGKRLRLAYEIMEDSGLSLAKPISSTVANDIILLSSLLTGPKALTTWSLQHEQGEDTNWQDTLAILLNVDCSEISYAIAGTINYDVVKCIVYSGCKEAISRLNLSTPCGENQGESAEQVIRPDSARGARLLKEWSTYSCRDTSAHVQDIFDIVSHLGLTPNQDPSYWISLLVLFIHRRVAARMCQLLKESREFWGGHSPFTILQECLPDILRHPAVVEGRSFHLKLDPSQLILVKKFMSETNSTVYSTNRLRVEFHLGASNMSNWIALFQFLWIQMEDAGREVCVSDKPDLNTRMFLAFVSSLHQLHPVWVYIFSLRVSTLHQAIAAAEIKGRKRKGVHLFDASASFDSTLLGSPNFETSLSYLRVIQAITKVTSWYSAAISLASAPNTCTEEDAATILTHVGWQGQDRKPVGRLWAVAQSAVVHVEAALLEYVYDNHSDYIRSADSVSTCCCPVCWMVQRDLLGQSTSDHLAMFLVIGSLGRPWVPPAGFPVDSLISIRDDLVEMALESTIVDGTAREAECGMDVDLPDGPSDGEGSTSSEYLKGDQRQGEDGIDSEQSIGDTTMQDLDDVELQDTAEVFDFLPDTDMEDAEEGGTRDSAFQSIRHALFTGNEDSWVYKWHPTAGAVIGHEPTAHERWKSIFHPEKKTGQPYLPFGSRLDWEIAQWAIKEKIPQNSFDRLLKIPEVKERLGLSFTHSRSMLKIIDEIPEPRGHWAVKKFSFKDRPHEHFTVRYRDPVEAIKGLWGSPAFAEHLVYKPAKLFRREEETDENRIYSEMWTGGLWNAAQYLTQEAVPEGATIAPVITASDQTQLTLFSGGLAAYPVYLTLGNIPKSIRRKPGSRACVLIAYLSADKPDKTGLSPDSLRLRKREIFHRSMAAVLQPLKEAGDPKGRGLELVGGDGAVRRVYPILAVYVADYPEQCLVTCTKSGTCPRCRRKADELELPTPGIPRKQAWTQQIIQDAYSSCSTQLAAHELCMEDDVSGAVYQPFWVGFPLSDIHRTMAPDVLHQLYLGVIPYLILWTQGLMGEGELDKRASALPPTFGVRHFKKGISQLSQVTGSERKQMAQILLSCLIGKIHTKGIIACRSLLHFAYLAQYHSHEHDTLEYMKADLKTWHRYRSYFIAQGTREAFNIPKFHALLHYIESIQMLGTTDNYSSEMFERLHIDFAKEGWRASNKRDPFPQMITWLSRREKIASYDFYLSWLEQEFSPDGSGSSNKDKLGGDKAGNGADDGNVRDSDEDGACDEDDDEEDGDEEGDEITPNKSVPRTPNAKPAIPSIFLAKHPREPKKSLSKIVTSHAAPSFIPHLKLFLNSLLPVNQQVSKNQALQGTLPFTALDVWHQVKIRRPHAVDDHPDGLQETLKSIPVWKRAATSRFDTAILLDTDKAESNGVDGCRVARLQIIFQLPSLISHDGFPGRAPPEWPTEPLVYVAWFSRFKDIDATTGMYRVDRPKNPHGLAHGAIVPLVNIRQSCIWKNTCVFSSL
ncbi:hypothetical protein D9757_014942 [Collybiopsis confluens]|uniref:Ubiquitin-like protease family profile domain-containing protein n=1 Tax=Collybiopsis confluens TaxID=2823264 RepID=A0A8H5CTN1_9AGAR|nr:hypothetical protein D9757_014942 [Collybiopsis confluens]